MTTILDKALKRQITVGDADYIVVLDPDGMRLVGKGKRRSEVELRWSDLLNGEAALAAALNASLAPRTNAVARPAAKERPARVVETPKPKKSVQRVARTRTS